MSARRLSDGEILDLYEDAQHFVVTCMRTTNNPAAKLGPHDKYCIGRTHATWNVEGINETNVTGDMMRKLEEMFPHDENCTTAASISHETRADGRSIVMKLNIPILFGVQNTNKVQLRVGAADSVTFEWPLFLTMLEGLIGGILYWKYSNGTLSLL